MYISTAWRALPIKTIHRYGEAITGIANHDLAEKVRTVVMLSIRCRSAAGTFNNKSGARFCSISRNAGAEESRMFWQS